MKKIIATTLMIGGFVFMLFTAGNSDLNMIPFGQTVIRAIIGLVVFGGGYAISNI